MTSRSIPPQCETMELPHTQFFKLRPGLVHGHPEWESHCTTGTGVVGEVMDKFSIGVNQAPVRPGGDQHSHSESLTQGPNQE